jgi:adhesin transport system outer membrane protein
MITKRNLVFILLLFSFIFGIATAGEAASAGGAQGKNSLESALQAAVTMHPTVKSKMAELDSLGFSLAATKALRLPSIGLVTQSISDTDYTGLLRVQYVLSSFGKIEGAIAVDKKRIDVKGAELFHLYRMLIEETAAAYVRHWGAKQRLRVAEENTAKHDELYQMITRRKTGGIASEADVHLANSRLLEARAQQEQMAGAVEKAFHELNALTQIAVYAEQPVDPKLAEVPSSGDLLRTAREEEAFVKVRQAEVELVRKEADLARAQLNPSTLFLRFEQDIDELSAGATNETRIGVAFEGSLEGMGVIGRQRVKAQEARITAAQEQVENVRNEIRRKISGLATDRSTQTLVSATYGTAVSERQSTLESFMRQYDAGRKSWLDVLNSQREVYEMKHLLEQSRTNWLEVSLRLAAINGLLDPLAGGIQK